MNQHAAHPELHVSQADLLAACTEFLEAFVHQTLFIRSLYPTDLFTRSTWHGIIVHKARHPDLIDYVRGAIDSLQAALKTQVLRRFALVVKDASGVAIERHVLDMQLAINTDTVVWSDVVSAMRGMLTKHSLTSNTLPSLPNNGCTFEIAAYTLREGQSSASVSPQLWVEELPGASGKPDVELPSPFEAVFVKSVHLPGMAGVQVYLEVPPGHAL